MSKFYSGKSILLSNFWPPIEIYLSVTSCLLVLNLLRCKTRILGVL